MKARSRKAGWSRATQLFLFPDEFPQYVMMDGVREAFAFQQLPVGQEHRGGDCLRTITGKYLKYLWRFYAYIGRSS